MSHNAAKKKKKRLSLVPDLLSLSGAHDSDTLLSRLVQTVQNASYKGKHPYSSQLGKDIKGFVSQTQSLQQFENVTLTLKGEI